jgi:hypothetical protein
VYTVIGNNQKVGVNLEKSGFDGEAISCQFMKWLKLSCRSELDSGKNPNNTEAAITHSPKDIANEMIQYGHSSTHHKETTALLEHSERIDGSITVETEFQN